MKKQLSKVGVALLVIVVIIFMSCDTNGDDGEGSGVDFTSHNVSAAFFVDNHTPYRLVAFKGSLAHANLLGGIPAGAEYHGIWRNPSHFNRNEAFPVILITEDQFIENRNNLSALTNTPFSRIAVFYNHQQPNPQRYAVSGHVGGRHTLRIVNGTGLDVDLRVGGQGGPTIGFATRQMMQTELNMTDGQFLVFPVFRFFNEHRGVLVESFPERDDGGAWFRSLVFSGAQPAMVEFNVADAFEVAEVDMTLGAAWIIVVNDAVADAINVQIGGTPQRDTMGFDLFMPGQTRIVSIDMPGIGAGSFVSYRTISNISVGVGDVRTQVIDQNNSTSFTLRTDHQYIVRVSGSVAGGFTANIDTTAATRVDIRDLHAN